MIEWEHTPVGAQGSGCWLNSLLTLSCTSLLAMPSSSFSCPPSNVCLRPSSSSSIPLLFRSSSSRVTRFSQACDADVPPGLGTFGAKAPPSPLQAPTSSEGHLRNRVCTNININYYAQLHTYTLSLTYSKRKPMSYQHH